MVDVKTKLNLDVFKLIPQMIDKNVDGAILETAQDIKRDAVQMAPKKTGSLKASLYLLGQRVDEYAPSAGKAGGLNPKATVLGALAPNEDKHVVAVASAVQHAWFMEYGTAKTPAQPFLGPAAVQNRGNYSRRMRKALSLAVSEAAKAAGKKL